MAAGLLGPSVARSADIVDTAVAAGSFTTLVTAVKAAGLVNTLKGKGPFTVFAPNDAAFAKLPPGTVDSLLKNKAKLFMSPKDNTFQRTQINSQRRGFVQLYSQQENSIDSSKYSKDTHKAVKRGGS